MLVTLYLFGTSVVISLKSIGYDALRKAVWAGNPELTLPLFSDFYLCLSYKATKNARATDVIDIAPRSKAEDFPIFKAQWSEVSIFLVITVSVYKAGKGMVAKNSNLLFTTDYFSNVPIGVFVKDCNNTLASHLKGRTMETACCDKDSIMFSAEHLLNPLQNLKEYFVVQDQSRYSHANITQLLTKVAFPEVVIDHIKEHGMKRKFNENTKYLDAFTSTLPAETPLQTAVKRARTELRLADWKPRVDACVDNLALLNKHVACASFHSESARRLLINEVVKQVIAYTGGSFYVEELQNTAKTTDEQFLGWGSLDYTISTDVLLTVLGDESEDETAGRGFTQSLCAEYRSVRTPADEEAMCEEEDEEEEETGEKEKTIEEVKVLLDDGGLAQGGSQSHDRLLEAYPEIDRVALVLCTGHKWRHFVLQRGTGGAGTKPILTYFGEASMRILRSTIPSSHVLSGKFKRYTSCRNSDDYNVNRGEVENVMLSLLCSMGRKLDPAEIGTTVVQSSSVKAGTTTGATTGVSSSSSTGTGAGTSGL